MLAKDISVQMFSLRDCGGIKEALQMVKDHGFTGVELAGYGGLDAHALKEELEARALCIAGAHVGLDDMENALDKEIEIHKTLGTKWLVIPYMLLPNAAALYRLIERIRALKPRVEAAGFSLAYHNHNQEFQSENGQYFLDILLDEIPGLFLELDVYWAASADADPLAYMERRADRLRLVHLKQMKDRETKRISDLHDGCLDIKSIIEKGRSLQVEHFIWEQDYFDIGAESSLRNARSYLDSLTYK